LNLEHVEIIGTGSYAPPNVLTNDDLRTKMGVDTTDEWITTRTGIKERHVADENTFTSHLAAEAARRALTDAGLEATDIDMLVVCTCTPDMFFPSTACFVQHAIGANNAFCFDLNAVCSGFVYGLTMVRSHLAAKPGMTALLIGAEKLSSLVKWEERATSVLFGDGAGAVVLRSGGSGRGIYDVLLGSDGSLTDLLQVPLGGCRAPGERPVVQMKGTEVFKHAVTNMTSACVELVGRNNLAPEDIKLVIPHQANKRIIAAIQERLDLPDERMMINVDRYGNTSAASIPIALDEAARGDRLAPGDNVLFVAFGGGFTWGACLAEWGSCAAE